MWAHDINIKFQTFAKVFFKFILVHVLDFMVTLEFCGKRFLECLYIIIHTFLYINFDCNQFQAQLKTWLISGDSYTYTFLSY